MAGSYKPKPLKVFETEIGKMKPIYYKKIEAEFLSGRTLEQLTFEEKLRLAKMKVLCEQRERDYGILYYEPYNALKLEKCLDKNGEDWLRRVKDKDGNNVLSGEFPQELFHKSQKKIRLVVWANQVGKTQMGSAESQKLSLGIHPHRRLRKNNKTRIVGSDLQKGIGEVIWPKYESLMPRWELSSEPKRNSTGQVTKVHYKIGSSVEFLSYEQDPKLFEGWVGDFVWFDEPPPQRIFTACFRGLMRYNGIMVITATPLMGSAWMYDELYLKAGPGIDQPDVFKLPIYANPYLSDKAIELYETTIPPEERRARLLGEFEHLTGLIYKEFDQMHKIESFSIPKDWSRYMCMDFHQREACAILWCAVDPKGTLYFYDELRIDKTIFEIANLIMTKEKLEYGKAVTKRLIDSIAATPDRATGFSALKEFSREGAKLKWHMRFKSSVKSHSDGFKSVHEYLQIKNNVPGVYFFQDKVPHTINDMMHLQWDDEAGVSEKVKAGKFTHFADCVRYICVSKPTYRIELTEEERREEENINPDEVVTGYRGG